MILKYLLTFYFSSLCLLVILTVLVPEVVFNSIHSLQALNSLGGCIYFHDLK